MTPTNTNTPTPPATQTPTNTPPPTATSTPASDTTTIFTQDFSSGCLYTANDSDRSYACENGEYTLLNKASNLATWSYTDSRYDEADAHTVTDAKGIDYGVLFRASDDGKRFYIFLIDPDAGGYGAFYHADKWNNLIPFTKSDAIKTGTQTNKLKIVAQASQLAFYANGQFLDTVTDSSLAAGKIGFYLESTDPNAKAAFDNLTVSKINRPLTMPAAKARAPAPTRMPDLPAGTGGVVVTNFCGFDVNIDLGGQFRTIPVNGNVLVTLAPGHYPISATAGGKKLVCGGGGCAVDVEAGIYIPFTYCGGPAQ